MKNNKKCLKCNNYVNEDELKNISLPNGPCWINICKKCVLIVEQEILDLFENNTEIIGYAIIENDLNTQKNLNDFSEVYK